MIKRLIACITICLIITGLISPVFSNASALPQPNWSDPGISEIINISDLTGWMLNGGTYDVSTYTNAEDFMTDYFNARTRTRLVSPDEVSEDYYEVLPGFGINNQLVPGERFANPLEINRVIASSFRDHTGYGRRFSNKVNDALLSTGHLYDTKIPLLNEVEFANFVNYNHDALRLYNEFFQSTDPSPTPNPGPDFTFINNINYLYVHDIDMIENGDNITFKNIFGSNMTKNFDFNNISIFGQDLSQYHTAQGYDTSPYFSISNDIITINLTTNQDQSVSAAYSPSNINFVSMDNAFDLGDSNKYQMEIIYSDWTNDWSCMFNNGSSTPNFQDDFAGLSTAINYVYSHFCNINLYVDGILWVLTGDTSSTPSISPEFPDAVGGEDLPSTTWPVHRPLAPYFITSPGMLQAIQDAIDDDGKLDIDDLKPYLTDENGDPVPDPQFDPEPVPIPVPDPVNPDVVPGLPVLPAMPPEMPGFNGVSVLAEIINFTNQSLPTVLVVTFWGIIFGIVILGLIKILHK